MIAETITACTHKSYNSSNSSSVGLTPGVISDKITMIFINIMIGSG